MQFKKYLEAIDIFGFDKDRTEIDTHDPFLTDPINQFDTELMMNFLSKKSLNTISAVGDVSKVQWGNEPGAIKVEVDPGFTFYIKRLNNDKAGNPRWVTKKMFQLNRNGYGGYEDSVAQEIHECAVQVSKQSLDAPKEKFDGLEDLSMHIYNKLKRSSKPIFIPEGIKKMSDNAYLLCFGLKGQGVQWRSQDRVEQNQTAITYDEQCGTIRITNYNLRSSVGGLHEWKLMPSDLDVYFFPTQTREEIAEAISVHMKYY